MIIKFLPFTKVKKLNQDLIWDKYILNQYNQSIPDKIPMLIAYTRASSITITTCPSYAAIITIQD